MRARKTRLGLPRPLAYLRISKLFSMEENADLELGYILMENSAFSSSGDEEEMDDDESGINGASFSSVAEIEDRPKSLEMEGEENVVFLFFAEDEDDEEQAEFDYIMMGNSSDSSEDEEIRSEPAKKKKKRETAGRPPLHHLYPEMIPCLEGLINQTGAAAHDRRREETTFSNGVSLKDMRNHLLSNCPRLKADVLNPRTSTKLSIGAIHHCLLAPRKNSGKNLKPAVWCI